jgi:hypothetical protein
MVKITDISIELNNKLWILYIPIKHGHLQLTIEYGTNKELDDFLTTAINAPTRRFGEQPTSNK